MQEYIDLINLWLAPVGISFNQLITGILAVAASFIGARFGTAESRRQFRHRTKVEKLVAAGELLTMLQRFERALREIVYDIENAKSSGGHAGHLHAHFSDVVLDPDIHSKAAILSADIVEDTIVLAARFDRGITAASATHEFGNGEDAVDDVLGWSAALVIEVNALINRVTHAAGLKVSARPIMKIEQLEKLAEDRLEDDEYSSVIRYR